mmetsp:Transcript_83784/g.233684  ORF Transcript_83784/g.233684 Transcript_83784/m.233684 type:complete len:286 (+) Transcript_83784:327-1184(+)
MPVRPPPVAWGPLPLGDETAGGATGRLMPTPVRPLLPPRGPLPPHAELRLDANISSRPSFTDSQTLPPPPSAPRASELLPASASPAQWRRGSETPPVATLPAALAVRRGPLPPRPPEHLALSSHSTRNLASTALLPPLLALALRRRPLPPLLLVRAEPPRPSSQSARASKGEAERCSRRRGSVPAPERPSLDVAVSPIAKEDRNFEPSVATASPFAEAEGRLGTSTAAAVASFVCVAAAILAAVAAASLLGSCSMPCKCEMDVKIIRSSTRAAITAVNIRSSCVL